MNLNFSPSQTRCLDALGYTLYALAGSERDSGTPPAQSSDHATTNPRDAKLLAAILRAARMQTDAADPQVWLSERGVDSIASLRGDPAAKRALWATLRRERRAP
jgi:hypothetical protein